MTVADYLRGVADLSPVDRAIVELLQADGRLSFAQIGSRVGVTEKTARRRVHSLADSGVIQIAAVTDPRLLGYGAAALIGISATSAEPPSVTAEHLLQIRTVDYVVTSVGRFAVYAELFAADLRSLHRAVEQQIRPLPGVAGLEVFPYLRLFYQQPWFTQAREKPSSAAPGGVRSAVLSDMDQAILAALSKDGRMPFQQIARELGISEAQVRNRVGHMTDAGALKVIAIINPMALDFRTMAWLGIRVRPGFALTDLAGLLADLRFVTYVAICAGSIDIFAEVICVSEDELLRLVDDDVRTLPGIADLELSLYVDLHYRRLQPLWATAEAQTNAGSNLGHLPLPDELGDG
jgi:DNA-binding Lrp family transcriptional regulator